MNLFNENFDILNLVKSQQLSKIISDNCSLHWPFFTWNNKNDVIASLEQLLSQCVNMQHVFSASNDSNELTCLYKLTQSQKPPLWCGFLLKLQNQKIYQIRVIFDSFEYIKGDNEIEIFGFEKSLSSHKDSNQPIDVIDVNALKIISLIENFFLKKYDLPIQATILAINRLKLAAIEASAKLKDNDSFTIFLPFFSANVKGPIQFSVTIVKKSNGAFEASE